MDLKLRFFWTNWINFLWIFGAVYLSIIIAVLCEISTLNDLGNLLVRGFVGGLFTIFLFGFYFWIGFITIMFLLDIIFLNINRKYLLRKLFLEWIIVSIPFIYWESKYSAWLFFVAVVAFLIAQLYRAKAIDEIITLHER